MFYNILISVSVLVACFINSLFCDDIFGCGGFVKSNFGINYSRVEIKLYTKQGSLKYQTDCAPNNGYYLIPLYDKGDYILKIEPPLGWSFEPSTVSLHVDGTSDPCSLNQDINFIFNGFTVTGQVLSRGGTIGPAGIQLTLKTPDGEIHNQTVTTDNGYYSFPSLYPGKYIIIASHKLWIFDQSSEVIQVIQDNVKTENQIIVAGYDVTGHVYSEGEPIQGVSFLLFSKKAMKTPLGCNAAPVKSFNQNLEMTYICHVASSSDGKFYFPSIPPGDYKLVPFYKGENIEFDVSPPEMDFTINQTSLKFQENFQVQGFSVSGKISTGLNGRGLQGAEIYLNGNKHTISDSNGMYHLENMRAGTYQLEIRLPNVVFEPVTMKVTPNTPRLPDIYASKFSICGEIVIDEYPTGLARSDKSLVLKSIKNEYYLDVPVNSNGLFCCEASPGKYELEPVVSDTETSFGLQFTPAKHTLEVTDKPLTKWKFAEGDEFQDLKYGSGYPNDPITKKFLAENIDEVFGFPQLVRFSWSTADKILESKAAEVMWEEIEDEKSPSKNTQKLFKFIQKDTGGKKAVKPKSHNFFTQRNIYQTEKL